MDRLRAIEAEDGADDAYRAFHDDAPDTAPADAHLEPPPAIGTDERRMHVRAYNYWVSLLGNRAYPCIEDVDPEGIEDFGAHSVLLDFTEGPKDPAIPFLGRALREEGGLSPDVSLVSDVPSGSLISRLTDHYLQIIANKAPIGFEAEFVNRRGNTTLYRGILMPFSSDDDTIDFIYGVINWKELAGETVVAPLAIEVADALAAVPTPTPAPTVWADGPNAAPRRPLANPGSALPETLFAAPLFGDEAGDAPVEHRAGTPAVGEAPGWVLPEADHATAFEIEEDGQPDALAPEAALGDCLAAARESVEIARRADGRGRAALYRALGLAYDFARLAEARPDDYATLLEDAGIKRQARAPLTPLVKLIFGVGYDKTRLTEFAAALGFAFRHAVPLGGLAMLIEAHPGGLKAVVAAERQARRGPAKADPGLAARDRLRHAPARVTVDLGLDDQGEDEFVLLVARREAGGALALLGAVPDAALVERAIRKLAA